MDPSPQRARPGLTIWREDEAEARLADVTARLRQLEVEQADDLALVARSRHYRFEGCATLTEYGRRLGLRPCETWDRTKTGLLLLLHPELRSRVMTGEMTFQAAGCLYDVLCLDDEDTEEWTDRASSEPTQDFVRAVKEHLMARRMQGPPIRMDVLISERGKQLFDEAQSLVENAVGRALSAGEVIEEVVEDYVERWSSATEEHADPVRLELVEARVEGAEPSRYIPREVRRAVRARDGHRCRVPGCRIQRRIHFSHIVAFRHGGRAVSSNLILLCSLHNHMVEAGLLRLSGTGEAPIFLTAQGSPYVFRPSELGTSGPDPGA